MLPQSDQDLLAHLLSAHTARQASIENRMMDAVRAEMMDAKDWYKPDVVQRTSRRVGRIVQAGSQQAAAAEDAFLTQAIGIITGERHSPGPIRVTNPFRQGVDSFAEEFERPAETLRFLESLANPEDEALRRAIDRADAQARTDAALARREQARETLSRSDKILGYRRIIRPEMSKSGVCGLCVVASQIKYRRDDLLPIHDRCNCDILPITEDHDPGLILNNEDLGRLYEAATIPGLDDIGTRGWSLKEVRVRFIEHGELGPVIEDARHRSRNPGARRLRRDVTFAADQTVLQAIEDHRWINDFVRDFPLDPFTAEDRLKQIELLNEFETKFDRILKNMDLPLSVESGTPRIDFRWDEEGTELIATINVFDGGTKVGNATRKMMFSPDGRLVEVIHDIFILSPEYQGRGFASKFNSQMYDLYRRLGRGGPVTVKLHANIDVGGYSWAKAGFDWDFAAYADPSVLGQHLSDVFDLMEDLDQTELATIDRWRRAVSGDPQGWPKPYDLAMLGYKPGATWWPGKEAMLKFAWHGKREL